MRLVVASLLAFALGASLLACTERGGGGDPVGVWTVDVRLIQAQMRPRLELHRKKAEMVPDIDKDDAKKELEAIERAIADLEKLRYVLELGADHSATIEVEEPNTPAERAVGSWTRRGSSVTVTLLTMNGQPYDGPADQQSKTLEFRGDTLSLTEKGARFPLVFKR